MASRGTATAAAAAFWDSFRFRISSINLKRINWLDVAFPSTDDAGLSRLVLSGAGVASRLSGSAVVADGPTTTNRLAAEASGAL